MEYIIIIIGLCAVNALQCVLYHIERRDLYDRIMCGNITEYRHGQRKDTKSAVDAHKQMMNEWRKPVKDGD